MTTATQMFGGPKAVVEQPLLLCVSDDARTVRIVRQMFGTRMEIVSTADQIEALDLIKSGSPAAVVFDMAPEHFMAGLEALHMHCNAQSVPLIAITPSREAATLAHAMSAGAIDCVVKPLCAAKLHHRALTTIADTDDGAQVLDMAAWSTIARRNRERTDRKSA